MRANRNTYCNPLPLPDYARGMRCRNHPEQPDFREMSDPSALYYDGKWYLYPSCGNIYVTGDFCNWQIVDPHCNIGNYYAPTILHFRGRFYLLASGSDLFVSDSPAGPFASAGRLRLSDGTEFFAGDPMLFADDDGRVYLYYNGVMDDTSVLKGSCIMGVEMDPDDLTRAITPPRRLITLNPEHTWECFGASNQNKRLSYIEGAWMIKLRGRYYLTYSAPNTEYRTYAMGVYVSDSPLSGFTYAQRNPITGGLHGLIQGPGHGSIVEGPGRTLWAFYTCMVCYTHRFERRIGLDPAGIDGNGDLFVLPVSETPQNRPGALEHPERGNDAELLSLSHGIRPSASSCAPGRDALYATDGSMLSFWQPADGDAGPALTLDLQGLYRAASYRILWRDMGLSYDSGRLPGPFRYLIEGSQDGDQWAVLSDMRENDTDMLIDYVEIEPCRARYVRLTVTGAPEGITPGLIDFSVFGAMESL